MNCEFRKDFTLQYLGRFSLHARWYLGQYLISLQRYGGSKVSYKCYAQSAILDQKMTKYNSAIKFELPSLIAKLQVIPIRGSIFSTYGTRISQNSKFNKFRWNRKFHENFGSNVNRDAIPLILRYYNFWKFPKITNFAYFQKLRISRKFL